MNSIDIKYNVSINFSNFIPRNFSCHNYSNKIFLIDDFFTVEECNKIITKSNEITKNIVGRNRSLFFCDDLHKLLENKFETSLIYSNLSLIPHGFNVNNVTWKTFGINKCFRVNKYINGQLFPIHRDSQYTEKHNVKSKYTLLIYLNDNYENGNTTFYIPKYEYINEGYTINEEINKFKYDKLTFKPKTGSAIIFDQTLLHESHVVFGTKYVMRADILTIGMLHTAIGHCPIYNMCSILFRQAQYQELLEHNNIKHEGHDTNELYEMCIAIRQTPYKITRDINDFNKYIVKTKLYKYVNDDLIFVLRDGLLHEFAYVGFHNIFELLDEAFYVAVTMSFSHISNTVNKQHLDKFKKIDEINKDLNGLIITDLFSNDANEKMNIKIECNELFIEEQHDECLIHNQDSYHNYLIKYNNHKITFVNERIKSTIYNLSYDESNNIHGKISYDFEDENFNHASCCCSTSSQIVKMTTKIKTIVKVKAFFTITKDFIIINIIPNVIL